MRELAELGHSVKAVSTAYGTMPAFISDRPDLVVLGVDAVHVLQLIRGISDVPVITLDESDDFMTVARLFGAGTDDFAAKPLSAEDLTARVEALLGQPNLDSGDVLSVGELLIDRASRTVTIREKPLDLTRLEFDLLAHLAERPGEVVSKRALTEHVWRKSNSVSLQTIHVHLFVLRRKMGESATAPRYLHTIRGVGVKIVAPR